MPPFRFSHLLVAFLLTIGLTFFYSGSNTDQDSHPRHHNRVIQARQAEPSCEYKGNPDLYGIGIRCGLYLQWTASIISKAWTPSLDSLRDLLDADAIFLLAIFVATSVYSAGVVEPAHDIDILILLHMFFGDVYTVIFEMGAKDRRISPISAWGSRYRVLVIAGMSAYSLWYWFVGINTLPNAPCGSVAFVFAKVALRGKVKIFFQICAIINFVLWGTFGFLCVMAFPFDPYSDYAIISTIRKTRWWQYNRDDGDKDPRRILGFALWSISSPHSTQRMMKFQTPEYWRIFKENRPFIWRLLTAVKSADGFHEQYKQKTRHDLRVLRGYLILNIGVALFSIVAIELLIHWNHISNAYSLGSTSQIIPLVIGICNLWRVILSLLNDVLINSPWHPDQRIFRLRDGSWKSFPVSKPERRLSSPDLSFMGESASKTLFAQTLDEDYKEWLIPVNKYEEKSESNESPTLPDKEYLGIVSLTSFLLSMASDSRVPSSSDLSMLTGKLFAFAQSKRLTVLAIMTEFENDEGNGYRSRELLLWPLTDQAAAKLAVFRKVDADPDSHWRFWRTDRFTAKLGLREWYDAKYDPDHILDRKKPLRKAKLSSSLAFSEGAHLEPDTWRRVWSLERKGADREGIAECLIGLLKQHG